MESSINVAKTLIHGAVIGLNTYIKPGGIHRLTPLRVFDEIICNLLSIIDHVVDAHAMGERVRKGEVSAMAVDYGKLYSGVLREVFRICTSVHPQYVIPLTVYSLVLGLSGVESIIEESSRFKKALETVNSVNRWSDLRQFIELLRVVGRGDMYDHLQSLGYTQLALLKSGISFNDLYRVLGSRWRGFTMIEYREGVVFGYLKKLIDYHKQHRSHESAILALYVDIVKSHIPIQLQGKIQEIELCKYTTLECIRQMHELDTLLRKNKISFEWASEIITLTTALGFYEGLR